MVNNCIFIIILPLLTANVSFLWILSCIQKLCGLSISDPLLQMLSEQWMTQRCHIPAHSAGTLPHVDSSTNPCLIHPNFLTFPYPAPSPQFPWLTIGNFLNLDNVHQVWAQSYAVGCMDECSMLLVIHTDSHYALTTPSMTHITSLTLLLEVNFVSNLVFAFSLNHNRQDNIKLIDCQSTWFGI